MFNIYRSKLFAVIAVLFIIAVVWEHKHSVRKDFPDPSKPKSPSTSVGARHTIEFDIDKPKSQYSLWDKVLAYFLADEIQAAKAKKVGYVSEQKRRVVSIDDIVAVTIIDINDPSAKSQEKKFTVGKNEVEEWIEKPVMKHRVGDQVVGENDGKQYQITITAITRKESD
jgi:hypothetical protein